MRLLAPLLIGICTAPLYSAEPVSLSALVEKTVANHPELRFYEAEVQAAKGGGKKRLP
jgi:hypothetical protein